MFYGFNRFTADIGTVVLSLGAETPPKLLVSCLSFWYLHLSRRLLVAIVDSFVLTLFHDVLLALWAISPHQETSSTTEKDTFSGCLNLFYRFCFVCLFVCLFVVFLYSRRRRQSETKTDCWICKIKKNAPLPWFFPSSGYASATELDPLSISSGCVAIVVLAPVSFYSVKLHLMLIPTWISHRLIISEPSICWRCLRDSSALFFQFIPVILFKFAID